MNTVKDKLIDACIIITITLVILVGLEIAARILKEVRDISFASSVEAPADSIILKQAWGKQALTDGVSLADMYVPYVEFREGPYTSATINVDEEGRRRVPHSCERENAFTILMFGGSTMFGAGVPDQFTIPAYLADTWNQGNRCIKIVNYGAGW